MSVQSLVTPNPITGWNGSIFMRLRIDDRYQSLLQCLNYSPKFGNVLCPLNIGTVSQSRTLYQNNIVSGQSTFKCLQPINGLFLNISIDVLAKFSCSLE